MGTLGMSRAIGTSFSFFVFFIDFFLLLITLRGSSSSSLNSNIRHQASIGASVWGQNTSKGPYPHQFSVGQDGRYRLRDHLLRKNWRRIGKGKSQNQGAEKLLTTTTTSA